MFERISEKSVLEMTAQQKRWLDNIKKAFYESDRAFQSGVPEDRCLEELFKAIDTAKTLRRSLRGEDISTKDNKKYFIEFLGLEIPCFRSSESRFELRVKRSGELKEYTFADIVYDIRCMVHENENLNAEEGIDYHILLDWSADNPLNFAEVRDGQITLNAQFLSQRLREVLAKFITGIESKITQATQGYFSISIRPDIGSVRPEKYRRRRQ